MGIHDGHRQRLREQFLNAGLPSFSDIQVLEFLLMHTIPRSDVNPLAHRLLSHFGSLSAVLDAAPADLQKIEGIGQNSAAFLALMPQLLRRYEIDKQRDTTSITTIAAAGAYLKPLFAGETHECVYLMCLDGKCKLLDCRKVFDGSVNSVNISIRKIMELALQQHATSVILAHNHVTGIASPSREDERTTAQLQQALAPVSITLADHIIVADGTFVSMKESGLLHY
ncbi:MAG: DNA repair protein RadC [Oscillospiraceae bacterium]|nr:DNA repair protein RadC [Oscillospiraceae bacterium]